MKILFVLKLLELLMMFGSLKMAERKNLKAAEHSIPNLMTSFQNIIITVRYSNLVLIKAKVKWLLKVQQQTEGRRSPNFMRITHFIYFPFFFLPVFKGFRFSVRQQLWVHWNVGVHLPFNPQLVWKKSRISFIITMNVSVTQRNIQKNLPTILSTSLITVRAWLSLKQDEMIRL